VVRKPSEEEEESESRQRKIFLITNIVVLIDRWDNCVDPAKKRRRKNERFSALIIITAYAVQAFNAGPSSHV